MEITEFFHFAKGAGFLPNVVSTSELKRLFWEKRPNTPEMDEVQFEVALDKLIGRALSMPQLPPQLGKLMHNLHQGVVTPRCTQDASVKLKP